MNLGRVLRRWRRVQWMALGLRAFGLALGGGALIWVLLPEGPFRWVAVLGVTLAATTASAGLPRPPMADRALLTSHLDRVLPELQDSSDLLARPGADLTDLELLQAQRIRATLVGLPESGIWPRRQMKTALEFLFGGAAVAMLVMFGQARWAGPGEQSVDRGVLRPLAEEGLGDPLQRVWVDIRPPAYTGQAPSRQESLDLEVAEGSWIRWRLPGPVDRASLVFVGQAPVAFTTAENGIDLEMQVWENGVYQLAIGTGEEEVRSAYARLAVLPDQAPTLRWIHPGERVTSVTAEPASLDLTLEVTDDHGLRGVDLVVTLAQGSGEMVEFRQHRKPMRPDPTGTQSTLESRVNLSEMGLESGSELYFFAEARDTREPEANIGRTSTYIVRYPAERVVAAGLGEGLPIVLPPEYFRSQRQIILDTERLIAEESDLTTGELQRRASGLGFDQRALRMRYGALLGEEFESGRPVGAGEEEAEHDSAAEEADGMLEGVPGDLVHAHDSAEIATFFTSETRSQLKQVLARMWEAEGFLRIHEPREALPYEYRALELLKDLQQRSRIYVQKVGFETPPLEPDRIRLTGDLEEIRDRSRVHPQSPQDQQAQAASRLLRSLREDGAATASQRDEDRALVRPALARLTGRRAEALRALEALDRWVMGEVLSEVERRSLAEALWHLVPDPSGRPYRSRSPADPLSELYRSALSGEVEP